MSTEITDYLTELNETDSLRALQGASSQKSQLMIRTDGNDKIIKAFVESFNDKKIILVFENQDLQLNIEKEVSVKFNIGTEIYFIKSFLKKHVNKYYFDMSTKVIQLKRRKEPRYIIPKKWAQSSSIMNNSKDLNLIKCAVIDVSTSGIRFEVVDQAPAFKRDDIIKINFQIYKRAEVSVDAIVRFILYRNGTNPIMGLEFVSLKDAQKERVINIIDDIKSFINLNKA